MNKWIAEFELEDGDIMPEHMDLEYKGAKIDFHCRPLEQEPTTKNDLGVDAISRAEVLKIFDEWFATCDIADKKDSPKIKIKALPSVTPQPRWIPVSERLPHAECGESNSVLVCFENGTQDVLYFNGSNWCYPTGETYISVNHKNDWHNKVVAWMPLPRDYSEVKE